MGHMRSWRGTGWRAMVLGRVLEEVFGVSVGVFWLAGWHGVRSTGYA
jgi:hypothetical protein